MPAAAVIPAPLAYIKIVAVKKLVVGFLTDTPHHETASFDQSAVFVFGSLRTGIWHFIMLGLDEQGRLL